MSVCLSVLINNIIAVFVNVVFTSVNISIISVGPIAVTVLLFSTLSFVLTLRYPDAKMKAS